jgi:AcrR family transcriptional regulator
MTTRTTVTPAPTTRDRVLRAAADLLTAGGREAVSTRAVSSAAGIQAPTLYRLFGDKEGLLDAVAAYGFAEYLVDKHALSETDDPVADLRRGWDLHVEFGLSRPAFYVLMYGEARPGDMSAAGREAGALLRRIIARVAAAGRLRMSVERAAQLVHATGMGVVLSTIATPPAERDPELSTVARENVLRAITTDSGPMRLSTGIAGQAAALRELLSHDDSPTLTAAERTLLAEWLNRLADATG